MRYYLGLDNGGTNTKAALFTPDGTQVAVESVATAALTPAPGFVERDMEDMWRDNCAVIRGVLKKSGVRAEEIAGVGLCGHGKGLYLWGKDGKSARHPLGGQPRVEIPGRMAQGRHGGTGVRPLLPARHGVPAGEPARVAAR